MSLSRRQFLAILSALASVGSTAACGGEDAEAAPTEPDPEDPGSGDDPGGETSSTNPGGGTETTPPVEQTPPAVEVGVDVSTLPEEAKDFPYGLMAGDATSTSAMIWTLYTGKGTLGIHVDDVTPGAEKRGVLSRALAAGELGQGGFIHVDATGLTPGARHRYTFVRMEGGKAVARGPLGRVRAALADDAMEAVTFAGTSCTHQRLGGTYPELMHAAGRTDIDFFLHGGDHLYTDDRTTGVDMTLAEYRDTYKRTWPIAGMRALHGSAGMVLTWDDHEIANNWNPETFPAARLEAARQAFFEHRAVRRDPANKNRLWRSFRWGKTLEIFVLDCRSERKPSTRGTAQATYVSKAQMDWLKAGLTASTAVFKIILNSVPITNFPGAAAEATDRWESYIPQREELLDHIAGKIPGVVFLSGDFHYGTVAHVGTGGERAKILEVLMGPGGTTARTPDLNPPQFEVVVGRKNYTFFKADPATKQLTVQFVGAGGTSLFRKVYTIA